MPSREVRYEEFVQSIRALSQRVQARLCNPQRSLSTDELRDLYDYLGRDEERWLREKQIGDVLGYAHRLLEMTDGHELEAQPQLKAALDEACKTSAPHPLSRDALCREAWMELLTAAWLGLYFLGVPFNHPWDRVRRMGAIPRGVCMHKASGDVYHKTRQINLRELMVRGRGGDIDWSQSKPETVLVLTSEPVFLIDYQQVLEEHRTELLAAEVYGLGFLYNLFQFRLYLAEGLPIKYVIRRHALQSRVSSRVEAVRIAECVRDLFARRSLPDGSDWQRAYVLRDDLSATGTPASVLGYKTGRIMTSETKKLHGSPGHEMVEAGLEDQRRQVEDLVDAQKSVGCDDPDALWQVLQRS
jgi:hypothetical protein